MTNRERFCRSYSANTGPFLREIMFTILKTEGRRHFLMIKSGIGQNALPRDKDMNEITKKIVNHPRADLHYYVLRRLLMRYNESFILFMNHLGSFKLMPFRCGYQFYTLCIHGKCCDYSRPECKGSIQLFSRLIVYITVPKSIAYFCKE